MGVGIVSGVASHAERDHPWELVVRSSDDPRPLEGRWGKALDGVISMMQDEESGRRVLAMGLPVVNMYGGWLSGKVPTVLVDDRKIGVVAARHLMDLGFARFGYLGLSEPESRLREAGFVEELAKERKTSVMAGAVTGDESRRMSWQDIYDGKSLLEFVKSLKTPVGVFCFNDPLASLLVEACGEAGLRVPDDVAILGVDNDALICEYAAVRISSVEVGLTRFGKTAAELLEKLMLGEKVKPGPVYVADPKLVVRRSTDTLAIEDAEVRTALAYIREHACDPIRMEDVLKRVAVSRATLDRKFADLLGRTPGAEIRRVRVSTAARMLQDPKVSLVEVANRAGYSSQQHLCRAFKEETGETPGTYRKKAIGGE